MGLAIEDAETEDGTFIPSNFDFEDRDRSVYTCQNILPLHSVLISLGKLDHKVIDS